jgi:hypothetical protein
MIMGNEKNILSIVYPPQRKQWSSEPLKQFILNFLKYFIFKSIAYNALDAKLTGEDPLSWESKS